MSALSEKEEHWWFGGSKNLDWRSVAWQIDIKCPANRWLVQVGRLADRSKGSTIEVRIFLYLANRSDGLNRALPARF